MYLQVVLVVDGWMHSLVPINIKVGVLYSTNYKYLRVREWRKRDNGRIQHSFILNS